jgi:hypothetical protein
MNINDLHLEIGKIISGIDEVRKDIAKLQIAHSTRIDDLDDDVRLLQDKANMGKGILWVLGLGSSFGFIQVVNTILNLVKH